MSEIHVKDIWAEDLFKWFYNHVMDSGGDGGACIVCKNYKEVSEWFVEWFKKEFKEDKLWHPSKECGNSIHFHDNNESFGFSGDTSYHLFKGEYVFVVVGECSFAFESPESTKKIQPIYNFSSLS